MDHNAASVCKMSSEIAQIICFLPIFSNYMNRYCAICIFALYCKQERFVKRAKEKAEAAECMTR